MNSISHAISLALLHFIWQGALVAILLWVALVMFRRRSAGLRYGLACGAFGVMAVLPLLTAVAIYRAPAAAIAGSASTAAAAVGSRFPVASTDDPWGAALALFEVWALPLWSAGVLGCTLRLLFGARQVAGLRRSGEAADEALLQMLTRLAARMGIDRPVEVLMSRFAESPCVVGWLRPLILIPAASLARLTAEQLESVLAHELAHIRRHDYLVNLLQSLVQTLFFYHPAVWLVSARMRRERELCCDDIAVEVCGDPLLYARALTLLERVRMAQPELALNAAEASLLYRIRRLTGAADDNPPSKSTAVLALCLAVICFLPIVPWTQARAQQTEATVVTKDSIWVDTVKQADLTVGVRALGAVVSSSRVELRVPGAQATELQIGLPATIDVRGSGVRTGTLVQIVDRVPVDGIVRVIVELTEPVSDPAGKQVDGVIRVRNLENVIVVGRPIGGKPGENLLFKLENDGNHAQRVKVRLGVFSVNTVQVLEGLKPGDKVILSDLSKVGGVERIELRQ